MLTENEEPQAPKANSRIVARSAAWISIDMISATLVMLVSSVAVARVIAPDAAGQARLGSYQYIVWLTTVTLAMGSFGIPATTRKYMAEYLNNGKPEIARATYLATLRIQTFVSLAAAAVGFAVVTWLADPHYFMASLLLVIAIVPRLVTTIPSQANNAAENIRPNTVGSVAGMLVMCALTGISLLRGWDFVGLAAAVLIGACLECGLKLRSVERWLGNVPRGIVPAELQRRMLVYSGQELVLLLLNMVVWDRSDVLILKAMNPDRRQIVYFSLPFSIAERVLSFPNMFAGALALTVMAQYGRDRSRVNELTVEGGRYALMIALPLLIGMVCVSRPLVLLVYGAGYAPMIPTLAIVAAMAIPKALTVAPSSLLQTMERQAFLIYWGCLCGAVDLGLDFLLVGKYGANGAAIANGTAQTMAALGIWIFTWRTCKLDLRLGEWRPLLISAAIMAAGVWVVVRTLPGPAGLAVAVATGAALWLLGLRLTAALKREDVGRFLSIAGQLPSALRRPWKSLVAWLAPSLAID